MSAQKQRPNILLILCDQLCARVLQIYGGPVPTPNLARLAAAGIRFDAAYCHAPICSPSRASILTGQYPHRHGLVGNVFRIDYPAIGGPPEEEGIDQRDVTTEGILAEQGYDTRYVGKWHDSGTIPSCYQTMYREHAEYAGEMQAYFDTVASGPREGYVDWYGWKLPVRVSDSFRSTTRNIPEKWRLAPRLNDFYAKIGILDMPIEQVYDYRIATKCAEAIRQADRPFMLTCSFNMPHDPNVVPARYYDAVDPAWIQADASKFCDDLYQQDLSRDIPKHAGDAFLREFLHVYYAAILMVDDQIGRILNALDERGDDQETILVFTADHGDMAGGHGMFWKSTNSFYDEIARVPLIIAAPGCSAGGHYDKPVELVDLMPTLLELCGIVPPDGIDGESLVPVLSGQEAEKQVAVCERLRPAPGNRRIRRTGDSDFNFMFRQGRYKYVLHHEKDRQARLLFDLEADPAEDHNLIGEPDAAALASDLHRALQQRLAQSGYHLGDVVYESQQGR